MAMLVQNAFIWWPTMFLLHEVNDDDSRATVLVQDTAAAEGAVHIK